MSDQKNDDDHMSLLDRPEVRQQRRRVPALDIAGAFCIAASLVVISLPKMPKALLAA
jgi:hypothetical protein